MNSVEIYIDGQRLDLFPDESITMNVSTQSVGDISKSFSDFTQSFTVPASDNNNHIFKHYYNADIQGGFTATTREDAWINIGGHLFREGGVELESVSLKGGRPQSYSMTFYGKVGALKDIFGGDKMSDLDFSDYNFPFTLDRFTRGAGQSTTNPYSDNERSVIFPLIFEDKAYHLRNSILSPTNFSEFGYNAKVSNGVNAVDELPDYRDMKPAISLDAILTVIQSNYDIELGGDLVEAVATTLVQPVREQMFMYLPSFVQSEQSIVQPLDFFSTSGITSGFDGLNGVNTITNQWVWDAGDDQQELQIELTTSVTVDLNIFVDGTYNRTLTFPTGTSTQTTTADFNTGEVVTFRIKPNNSSYAFQFTVSNIEATLFERFEDQFGSVSNLQGTVNIADVDFAPNVDVSASMPDITVAELFSGILKMFNLVIMYTDDKYRLVPLGDFYSSETPMDITSAVDISNMTVSKPELYKTISFKYKDAKTFDNAQWKEVYQRGFGDLDATFDFDGGELKIELPFENMIWRKLGMGSAGFDDLIVDADDALPNIGYTFDKNGKTQQTAPIWFFTQTRPIMVDTRDPNTGYVIDDRSHLRPSFYIGENRTNRQADSTSGGTTTTDGNILSLYSVWTCGNTNGVDVASGTQSTNFYAETIPAIGEVEDDTLYRKYWEDYLGQIYDNSRRLVSLSAVMPLETLLRFQSNSIVQIRDRKYVVDSAQINLTTGVVKMKLITNADDFTSLPDSSIYNTNSSVGETNVDAANTQ